MQAQVVVQVPVRQHRLGMASRDELHATVREIDRLQGDPDRDRAIVGVDGEERFILMPRRLRPFARRFEHRMLEHELGRWTEQLPGYGPCIGADDGILEVRLLA